MPFGYNEAIDIYREVFDYTKTNYPSLQLFSTDYVSLDMGGYRYIAENRWKQILMDINTSSIDGIGFQSHLKYAIPPETIYELLNGFDAYADAFKITEFDFVGVDPAIRADYLKDFMTITFSHPKMNGFQMWGFRDRHSWNLYNRPILDNEGNLKTSGQVYEDLVFNQWWTNTSTTTNSIGMTTIAAFKGQHSIMANYEGALATANVELTDDKTVQIVLPLELVPSACERASNGHFEQGAEDWEIHLPNGASTASATHAVIGGISQVNISDPGNAAYEIQLIQRHRILEAGKTYRIAYDARADSPRNMSIDISQSVSPFSSYQHHNHSLTTDFQHFSYDFSMNVNDANARINFYMGGNATPIYIDNVSLSELGCAALAIGEITFSVHQNTNQVVDLKWLMNKILDIKWFKIARSKNGKDWKQIGVLKSLEANNIYAFQDKSPVLGKNYYRITAITADGQYLYSPIRSIQVETTTGVSVFPNPWHKTMHEKINISFYTNYSEETIVIYNILGEMVYQKHLSRLQKKQWINIVLPQLKAGTYVLRWVNNKYNHKLFVF